MHPRLAALVKAKEVGPARKPHPRSPHFQRLDGAPAERGWDEPATRSHPQCAGRRARPARATKARRSAGADASCEKPGGVRSAGVARAAPKPVMQNAGLRAGGTMPPATGTMPAPRSRAGPNAAADERTTRRQLGLQDGVHHQSTGRKRGCGLGATEIRYQTNGVQCGTMSRLAQRQRLIAPLPNAAATVREGEGVRGRPVAAFERRSVTAGHPCLILRAD